MKLLFLGNPHYHHISHSIRSLPQSASFPFIVGFAIFAFLFYLQRPCILILFPYTYSIPSLTKDWSEVGEVNLFLYMCSSILSHMTGLALALLLKHIQLLNHLTFSYFHIFFFFSVHVACTYFCSEYLFYFAYK